MLLFTLQKADVKNAQASQAAGLTDTPRGEAWALWVVWPCVMCAFCEVRRRNTHAAHQTSGSSVFFVTFLSAPVTRAFIEIKQAPLSAPVTIAFIEIETKKYCHLDYFRKRVPRIVPPPTRHYHRARAVHARYGSTRQDRPGPGVFRFPS